MYHAYVRRQLRKGFGRLNARQFEAMMREFPASFELYFPGFPGQASPAYNLEETISLYDRIFQHYPDLEFQVTDMLVRGWPSYTRIAVEWTCRASEKNGGLLQSQGTHIFDIKWGKVVRLAIYADTAKIKQVCARLTVQENRGVPAGS